MKKTFALLSSLGLLLVTSASAQFDTNNPPSWTNGSWPSWTNSNWSGWTNQNLPTWTNQMAWWTNVSHFTNGHASGNWTNHQGWVRPARADRPDRPTLPADVQDWVSKFEASRAEWVKNNPTGGTMPDREAILGQIQALRDSWHDQSSQTRQQWHDQLQSMKDRFNDHRDRVLDGGGHGTPGTRDR